MEGIYHQIRASVGKIGTAGVVVAAPRYGSTNPGAAAKAQRLARRGAAAAAAAPRPTAGPDQ